MLKPTCVEMQGRLTLADGLWYAQEHCKVEAAVDIATLVRPVVYLTRHQHDLHAFAGSTEADAQSTRADQHIGNLLLCVCLPARRHVSCLSSLQTACNLVP
jgi:Cytosol aminopeptidase family, catalytic domain